MKRFENAQVGDLVYCRLYGIGTINCIDNTSCYPIKVSFNREDESYTIDGNVETGHIEPVLFYRNEKSNYLEERPKKSVPWEKVPVDTKVRVQSDGDPLRNRYYAGKKQTFSNGATSWGNGNNSTLAWDYIELAESVTIDGITYNEGDK